MLVAFEGVNCSDSSVETLCKLCILYLIVSGSIVRNILLCSFLEHMFVNLFVCMLSQLAM